MSSRSIADFGAPKQDSALSPVEDPETQLSADEYNALANECAQVSHTREAVHLTFLTVASGDPTIVRYKSIWGNGTAVQADVTRVGAGHYRLEFDATYQNELSEDEDCDIYAGDAAVNGSTLAHARVEVTSATQIEIWVWNSAGTLSDLTVGTQIAVWLNG